VSVEFGLTAEQHAIADAFGSFLAKESPPDVARSAEPLGFDRRLWEGLRAMGAPGMAAPDTAGGGGATMDHLVVVAEALGRAIAPVPLIEHLVASTLYLADDVVAGEAIATISLRPAGDDGAWRLVPAGAVADVVIGIDGDDLVAVRSVPPAAAPRNHACAPLADRSAHDGDRHVLGAAGLIEPALDAWKTLTAGALVGIAAAAFDMGVAYVRTREQFGVPVGSFQAVQHGLAELPGMVAGARFLAHKAAWASRQPRETASVDAGDNAVTDPSALASMAFLFASDVAALVTDRSLHYHGGYGYAAEYDIQLYYRRARGWALVQGDPAHECLALADRLWPLTGGR
jgi:alkylation response protein AidB-like acyl-CoA dehydrogenase